MIQNSRSPVVKSRISSSSGRTMSVEKRSLAWTGTMSSLAYLMTRAPSASAKTCETEPSASATTKGQALSKRPVTTITERDFIWISPSWDWTFFSTDFVRQTTAEPMERGTPVPLAAPRGRSERARQQDQVFARVRPSSGSRLSSGQNIKAFFETVGVERFLALLVVVGIVGVEPVAAAVHVEVGNLGAFGSLDEELPLRKKRCDPFDFGIVQMELPSIQILVH